MGESIQMNCRGRVSLYIGHKPKIWLSRCALLETNRKFALEIVLSIITKRF